MSFIKQEKKYYLGKPDKREIPRFNLSTIVSMDASKWELELSMPVNAPEMEKLLNKFQGQVLEENPFFGKIFLTAAFSRMNTHETSLLTVWETIDSQKILRMYFPVVRERMGVPGKKTLRCWSHDYAPLGVPIICREDAGEIIDRFLQLLNQADFPGISTLVFKDIPLKGIFATRIREILYECDMPYRQVITTDRAVLQRSLINRSQNILDINSKMRRNYRRQLRRLSDNGELQLERVDNYQDVILRFEEFLLLESSGWKKRQRTSMLTIKQTAAFARQAVTELSNFGESSIYSIRLDGKSVASLIMLRSNGTYFPWKIAIDENYSRFSPGALLMFSVSEALDDDDDFVRADSLAASSSQLVNPIWKQRIELGYLILPVGPSSNSAIGQLSKAIARKEKLRVFAKKLLNIKSH
jgi:hypothetical protein